MIRLIGINKIIMILVFGGLCMLFAFYYYMVSAPQINETNKELRNNNSEISKLTEDLDKLKLGIEQFKEQEDKFNALSKHDFFNTQDRVQARNQLNAIRDASGLISAQYTVKSAGVDKNDKMTEAGYQILNTPMEFSLEAVEDQDIFRFIYFLNYGFPGQITLEELTITRDEEITFPLLKQIGVGQADMRPLVTARIIASWRTIVPDTNAEVKGGDQ